MDNKLITLGYKFPDPITRVSWDNYVTVSADAKELGMSNEIVANGGLNGSYATLQLKTELS
jgi:molybdopterin-containing oxidoreductase family iron-sulfur binding subunit